MLGCYEAQRDASGRGSHSPRPEESVRRQGRKSSEPVEELQQDDASQLSETRVTDQQPQVLSKFINFYKCTTSVFI